MACRRRGSSDGEGVKFTVVTILPELVTPSLTAGVVGRASQDHTITVTTINPRDFTTDKHRSVDDTPYGGGPGMVMRPQPLLSAIAAAGPAHRILLSPAGSPLTQQRVRELAQLPHLVLVCGRYEGIDERVIEAAIDEQISIGDYVLSGGELGALVIIDAVARYVPGVLGEAASTDEESHSAGALEYPHYTRPAELTTDDGVVRPIPPVLAGGNHAAIASWRRQQSLQRTAKRRPDLYARLALTKADTKLAPPLHARTHLALVHHPVCDRTGEVITSALTNFDIHDLARSSMTYGLGGYHIVTPVTAQREKADYVARLWMEDAAKVATAKPTADSRARALALVRTAASIEDVIAELDQRYGHAPLVVATSAREESFAGIPRRSPRELTAECADSSRPVLLLLGTAWGLTPALIPSVSRVLTPIEGRGDYNHLSVRSAGAILLDRLFGKAT